MPLTLVIAARVRVAEGCGLPVFWPGRRRSRTAAGKVMPLRLLSGCRESTHAEAARPKGRAGRKPKDNVPAATLQTPERPDPRPEGGGSPHLPSWKVHKIYVCCS
jgi:hypothetical protein